MKPLKVGDIVRLRRPDTPWVMGKVVLASEKLLPFQSVAVQTMFSYQFLCVDYAAEQVTSLLGGPPYEVEVCG